MTCLRRRRALSLRGPTLVLRTGCDLRALRRHLIRDIGTFQLGLGAVLLLASRLRDTLLVALTGVAIGATAHTAAHIIDRDLGGQPALDIPAFGLITILLIAAAAARHRTLHR